MINGSMQDFALTLDKFLDHAAKWHPSAEVVTALGDGTVARIGYAELRIRALKLATVLQSLDVAIGDRVATLAWNSQAHVELWYAVMGMGAICHTLNPRLTAEQLGVMARQSEAKLLVVSADLLPLAVQLVENASDIRAILVVDGEAGSMTTRVDIIGLDDRIAEAHPALGWQHFPETAPSGLCFTSGTTGAPKGVTYTHRSSFLHTLRLLQADGMAISGVDAVLAVVPMFHANGWGLPFALPAAGGKLVLPGRNNDGASLARLIAAEGVTIGVGVPTVWLGVVEHVEATGLKLPSLTRVIVGGAPMSPALMARIEAGLGVKVQTSWGMTELSPLGTVARPSGDMERSASGRPAVGLDLLLTDEAGQPLSEQRNVEGHLHVRGAAVVERYFGEETSATNAGGWFPTGDLARISDQGELFVTGRSKDLIKSGGEWINPAEIEAVVGTLPGVSLAAVIGREHPKWGERPILLVELQEQAQVSDDALLAPLRERVASWWVPDEVVRLAEMPLAATGKIDKISLRARYGRA